MGVLSFTAGILALSSFCYGQYYQQQPSQASSQSGAAGSRQGGYPTYGSPTPGVGYLPGPLMWGPPAGYPPSSASASSQPSPAAAYQQQQQQQPQTPQPVAPPEYYDDYEDQYQQQQQQQQQPQQLPQQQPSYNQGQSLPQQQGLGSFPGLNAFPTNGLQAQDSRRMPLAFMSPGFGFIQEPAGTKVPPGAVLQQASPVAPSRGNPYNMDTSQAQQNALFPTSNWQQPSLATPTPFAPGFRPISGASQQQPLPQPQQQPYPQLGAVPPSRQLQGYPPAPYQQRGYPDQRGPYAAPPPSYYQPAANQQKPSDYYYEDETDYQPPQQQQQLPPDRPPVNTIPQRRPPVNTMTPEEVQMMQQLIRQQQQQQQQKPQQQAQYPIYGVPQQSQAPSSPSQQAGQAAPGLTQPKPQDTTSNKVTTIFMSKPDDNAIPVGYVTSNGPAEDQPEPAPAPYRGGRGTGSGSGGYPSSPAGAGGLGFGASPFGASPLLGGSLFGGNSGLLPPSAFYPQNNYYGNNQGGGPGGLLGNSYYPRNYPAGYPSSAADSNQQQQGAIPEY